MNEHQLMEFVFAGSCPIMVESWTSKRTLGVACCQRQPHHRLVLACGTCHDESLSSDYAPFSLQSSNSRLVFFAPYIVNCEL